MGVEEKFENLTGRRQEILNKCLYQWMNTIENLCVRELTKVKSQVKPLSKEMRDFREELGEIRKDLEDHLSVFSHMNKTFSSYVDMCISLNNLRNVSSVDKSSKKMSNKRIKRMLEKTLDKLIEEN